MRLRALQLVIVLAIFLCWFAACAGAAPRPSSHSANSDSGAVAQQIQFNPSRLVAQVMHNELDADRHDHSLWMYISDKLDHGKHQTSKVVETPQGDLRLLISTDGHTLSSGQLEKQKAQLDQVAHSPNQLAKLHRDEEQDDSKARQLMRMLPTGFLYHYQGQQNGIIHLAFRPNPKFNPPTREAKVFHAMAGDMWVQAREQRLVKLSGHLTQDVDFGLGILGKLHKGGTFELHRIEPAPGRWKTSLIDVHITGRALFFKSISEQQHEVDRDYRRVPKLRPLQAAKLLEGHTDLAQLQQSNHR